MSEPQEACPAAVKDAAFAALRLARFAVAHTVDNRDDDHLARQMRDVTDDMDLRHGAEGLHALIGHLTFELAAHLINHARRTGCDPLDLIDQYERDEMTSQVGTQGNL